MLRGDISATAGIDQNLIRAVDPDSESGSKSRKMAMKKIPAVSITKNTGFFNSLLNNFWYLKLTFGYGYMIKNQEKPFYGSEPQQGRH
jgi:hypothetical protein